MASHDVCPFQSIFSTSQVLKSDFSKYFPNFIKIKFLNSKRKNCFYY